MKLAEITTTAAIATTGSAEVAASTVGPYLCRKLRTADRRWTTAAHFGQHRRLGSHEADQRNGLGRQGDAASLIGDSLVESVLRTPELHSLIEEYGEDGLDAFVDNGFIDAVPVVGTIRKLVSGASSVRDAFLARKLVAMLSAIDEIPESDVAKWRARIDKDEGQDIGERVLATIDRITSTYKARLIGKVFREYLDGRCDCSSFLRIVEMIDSALTEDLRFLINDWTERTWDDRERDAGVGSRLIAVGLMKDQVTRLALSGSQTPAPSDEGVLLRTASRVVK